MELYCAKFMSITKQLFVFAGSLSQHGWQVIVSVILIFPCMAGICFLIFEQNKVIMLEIILCSLELIIQFAEIFYAAMFCLTACRPITYT